MEVIIEVDSDNEDYDRPAGMQLEECEICFALVRPWVAQRHADWHGWPMVPEAL